MKKFRWYSVELLEDKTIFLQPTNERLKHGAKGKILIEKCLPTVAMRLKEDNMAILSMS